MPDFLAKIKDVDLKCRLFVVEVLSEVVMLRLLDGGGMVVVVVVGGG